PKEEQASSSGSSGGAAAGAGAAAASEKPRLVAVTSCPTGIAHTYMAADALSQEAAQRGVDLQGETQGSAGATALDPGVIAAAGPRPWGQTSTGRVGRQEARRRHQPAPLRGTRARRGSRRPPARRQLRRFR